MNGSIKAKGLFVNQFSTLEKVNNFLSKYPISELWFHKFQSFTMVFGVFYGLFEINGKVFIVDS
jgi:hypothetical protein